jgi:hypothetical protein
VNEIIHKDLANGCWFTLTLFEQMGNIGSEVGRAAKWRARGNVVMCDSALDRALELIDLSISDQRWRGARGREICRAREVLSDTFLGDGIYNATPEDMEKYFYHFAVVARQGK